MSRRSLFVVPVAFALSAAVMFFGPYLELADRLAPRAPLEELPLADTAELHDVLVLLGDSGTALYREHLVWDVGFLIANAVALFMLLRFASMRLGVPTRLRRTLLALPILPALFDLAENYAIAHLLDGSDAWLGFAAFVTNAKLATFGVATLAVLLSWMALAAHAVKRGAGAQLRQVSTSVSSGAESGSTP